MKKQIRLLAAKGKNFEKTNLAQIQNTSPNSNQDIQNGQSKLAQKPYELTLAIINHFTTFVGEEPNFGDYSSFAGFLGFTQSIRTPIGR